MKTRRQFFKQIVATCVLVVAPSIILASPIRKVKTWSKAKGWEIVKVIKYKITNRSPMRGQLTRVADFRFRHKTDWVETGRTWLEPGYTYWVIVA